MDTDFEHIERYLMGLLSDVEKEVFEAELATNVELQNKLRVSKNITDFLEENAITIEHEEVTNSKAFIDFVESHESQQLKNNVQNIAQQFYTSHKKNRFPLNRFLYWGGGIAAIILVVITVLVFNNTISKKDLYATYYDSNDLPAFATRGDVKNDLVNGVTAFKLKHYDESILLLELYVSTADADFDPLAYAYLGFAYQNIGNSEKAISQFILLEKSNSLDNSRALWYKALVYIKQDDIIKAKEELSKILTDNNNFNYAKAKTLLKSL